jgi:hypothetical protein
MGGKNNSSIPSTTKLSYAKNKNVSKDLNALTTTHKKIGE